MDKNKLIKLSIRFSKKFEVGVTPNDVYTNLKEENKIHKFFDVIQPLDLIMICFLIPEILKNNNPEEYYDKIKNDLYSFCIAEVTSEDVEEGCESCDGNGYHSCDDCYGSGKEDCGLCDGDGKEKCVSCNGDGKDSEDKRCKDCKGKGKVDCDQCGGSGTFKCQTCGGDGEYKCYNCNGEGYIINDSKIEIDESHYISWDKGNQFGGLEILDDLDEVDNDQHMSFVNNPKNILISLKLKVPVDRDLLKDNQFYTGDFIFLDLNLDVLLKFSSGLYRNSPEVNDINLYSFY